MPLPLVLCIMLTTPARVAPVARTFFAACPKGLEGVLAREMRSPQVGGQNVEEAHAGVWFDGDCRTGMDALLWSRTANRVMELLSTARASPTRDSPTGWFTKDRLYDFARSIDWPTLLTAKACRQPSIEDCTFAVDATIGTVDRSLCNSHFTALEVKNALVDAMREAHDGLRPTVDLESPDLPLQLHVHEDVAWLFRTLSPYGSLHRRGYRQAMHVAVLRENLAAGLILEMGLGLDGPVDPDSTVLCDPMCGSGTLAIEAALIASNTAPGLLRWGSAALGGGEAERPPLCSWPDYDAAEWRAAVLEAERAVRPLRMRIELNDLHAGSVEMARQAFERLGLGGAVTFSCADVADYSPALPPTLVVANPPWGRRLGGAGAPDEQGWPERDEREEEPQSASAFGGRDDDDGARGGQGGGGRAGARPRAGRQRQQEEPPEASALAAWTSLGRFAKAAAGPQGLELWALSGASELTQHLRMRASRKVAVEHGGVELRWIKYAVLPPKPEWLGSDGRRSFDGPKPTGGQ